jgi:hypothetical protein
MFFYLLGGLLLRIREDSWIGMLGPIPQYVLEDIYSWLIDPDRKLSKQADLRLELSALT